MPDLDGALAWLNSDPLSAKALRGKVVLINFWTYSCINSLRELHHRFGEGEYVQSERVIQSLLRENGASGLMEGSVRIAAEGPGAPVSDDVQRPETYLGFARTENFASPERIVRDKPRSYSPPAKLRLNEWGLGGQWRVGAASASLESAPGKIVIRFHSRDLHMVLGPGPTGEPVRFTVRLNGAVPGGDHGFDAAADGAGVVHKPRMYQLIRQQGSVEDATFEIEFLDSRVEAFSVTFG